MSRIAFICTTHHSCFQILLLFSHFGSSVFVVEVSSPIPVALKKHFTVATHLSQILIHITDTGCSLSVHEFITVATDFDCWSTSLLNLKLATSAYITNSQFLAARVDTQTFLECSLIMNRFQQSIPGGVLVTSQR